MTPKVQMTKERIDKLNIINIKTFLCFIEHHQESERGRKFAQIICLTKNLYLGYIKNYHDSIIKKQIT